MIQAFADHLEGHFEKFRAQVIGLDTFIQTPYGTKKLIYADWIASGRLHREIEDKMLHQFGPMVGNTHSESTSTGRAMTLAYHQAHTIIKKHVNAGKDDVIITTGFGMTSVLAKFQRILGIKAPEKLMKYCHLPEEERPVVFLTHMEHHSNHTPWLESLAEVVVIPPDEQLGVDPSKLDKIISHYAGRKVKIGSFSACSNVTGIIPPYYELSEIMHRHGGYCFVDFAASAPYVPIDMHPPNPAQHLDAIFFSPHKFLGGPGTSGVLIFNRELYKNRIPDHPGGGTVKWTNPWGEHTYIDDIEIREDGGTPGFLQAIKTALCIRLKEKMGIDNMRFREEKLLERAFEGMEQIPGLNIMAPSQKKRIGVVSFYFDHIHHNLAVRLLNDKFGIQMRGGCSCAGTYGHYLLKVDRELSRRITDKISQGDLSEKPGWIRLSLHPVMTNAELDFIVHALKELSENVREWEKDYFYDTGRNEFFHHSEAQKPWQVPEEWFAL